ncbi:MAG TPA: DUF2269 family protein [Gaiellaceae bacterium]
MDRYHWLVVFHVSGAFLLLGGAFVAGVFNVAALRRERPSEIALLLGLTRWAVIAISAGLLVTLGFGLWLVHNAGYGWGEAWIVVSLVLWAFSGFLGSRGGRMQREARLLAERLAAAGDAPSQELRARLRDPVALALSWSSGLAALAILGLMIWKPGA